MFHIFENVLLQSILGLCVSSASNNTMSLPFQKFAGLRSFNARRKIQRLDGLLEAWSLILLIYLLNICPLISKSLEGMNKWVIMMQKNLFFHIK